MDIGNTDSEHMHARTHTRTHTCMHTHTHTHIEETRIEIVKIKETENNRMKADTHTWSEESSKQIRSLGDKII